MFLSSVVVSHFVVSFPVILSDMQFSESEQGGGGGTTSFFHSSTFFSGFNEIISLCQCSNKICIDSTSLPSVAVLCLLFTKINFWQWDNHQATDCSQREKTAIGFPQSNLLFVERSCLDTSFLWTLITFICRNLIKMSSWRLHDKLVTRVFFFFLFHRESICLCSYSKWLYRCDTFALLETILRAWMSEMCRM